MAGFPLLPALTCFFNVGAFLVHGGAQCRRPDVQQPHFLHATVEHSQRVLFVLVVVVQDLAVDKRGKHLRLQEAGQEGQVGLRLVRQEGGLRGTKLKSHQRIDIFDEMYFLGSLEKEEEKGTDDNQGIHGMLASGATNRC